jgi:LacI family transcriptional regulator
VITSTLRNTDRISARVRGMVDALSDAGAEPALVMEAEYTIEGGRRALRELLRRHPDVTAVPCTTDAHGIGAILEAAQMGIEIPGQLSVTGFDDLDLARQISPSLTTVCVPADELGHRAAEYILAAIEDKAYPPKIELAVDLVLRDSHAPPRRRSLLRAAEAPGETPRFRAAGGDLSD